MSVIVTVVCVTIFVGSLWIGILFGSSCKRGDLPTLCYEDEYGLHCGSPEKED